MTNQRTQERAVIPAGAVAWAGGDSAPADWDGGPVVLRNGSTMFPSNVSLAYHANGTNRWDHDRKNRNPAWDIIAYSAALTPDANTEAGAVAGVAAKLTKGERETLYAGCDVPRTNDEYSSDCICGGSNVASLMDKGLAQRRGRYPNGTILTPLGLAVRQHLIASEGEGE